MTVAEHHSIYSWQHGTPSSISLTTETPPTCSILKSTGSSALARWHNDFEDYEQELRQYRKTHPNYVPRISKWVLPHIWKRISEDLLADDEKTNGGPPNDEGVEAYLRREGRYSGLATEAGRVPNANAIAAFKTIR